MDGLLSNNFHRFSLIDRICQCWSVRFSMLDNVLLKVSTNGKFPWVDGSPYFLTRFFYILLSCSIFNYFSKITINKYVVMKTIFLCVSFWVSCIRKKEMKWKNEGRNSIEFDKLSNILQTTLLKILSMSSKSLSNKQTKNYTYHVVPRFAACSFLERKSKWS